MAWYMVWPGVHDMVYGMVCQAWHSIRFCLEDMAGYMIWPGGHGMVYGIWHCLARYGKVYGVI